MSAFLTSEVNSEFAHAWKNGREHAFDRNLIVRFYEGAERDVRKEEGYFETRYDDKDGREYQVRIKGTGRPEFRNVTFVEIIVPGDKDNIVNAPAWIDPDEREPNAHNVRFRDHYQAYLAKKEQSVEGLPLEQLPFLTPADREILKAEKFRTAEQIINAPQTVRISGFETFREKCKAFLGAIAGTADIVALATSVKALEERATAKDSEIEQLKRALAEATKGKR